MTKFKAFNFIVIFSFLFLLSAPTFAQVDVARKTTAVTYPLDQVVLTQFRGTTRFPRMKGEGKVKRTSKNGTEVEVSVSKMPRPFELGAGYATYVLWAISPDGQVDNLGEIKRRGFFEFDSKISVTTPLQTFALIITAEPHFLVRRPSRAVMLENLNPYTQNGRTVATKTAVEYFGNSSDYFSDARTPEIAEVDYSKTPSTILQARQAIALAKFAGAQRDALEDLQQAEVLLRNADTGWKAGRAEEDVDIAARQAVSLAVKAESTAAARKDAREKRNERTRQDSEIRDSEEKVTTVQNEMTELRAELARETRNRELAERDALNYSNQVRELRGELGKLREELGKTKVDAETVRTKLADIENRQQETERRQEEANRIGQIQANAGILMQSLRRFGTVNQTERGIVLTLPENFWATTRTSNFAPTNEAKLTTLGEVLASSADYKITIEAHTDNKGTPDELQTLTQERARSLMDKLMSNGVPQNRLVEAKGYGASLPVAANTTNANRAKNRRVQIILAPNAAQ
ncbi:MAG: OmpA family protein [Pyrinomonadaceae bacterium]|nr:OmpA family protein [Pyrinomonadaceae bacterium]